MTEFRVKYRKYTHVGRRTLKDHFHIDDRCYRNTVKSWILPAGYTYNQNRIASKSSNRHVLLLRMVGGPLLHTWTRLKDSQWKKNFPPMMRFLSFYPPCWGSVLGVILLPPDRKFWVLPQGESFLPPLSGQKFHSTPPIWSKISFYPPKLGLCPEHNEHNQHNDL